MRLDGRPTLPEVRAAYLDYQGPALRPFVEARRVTPAAVEACAQLAVEHRDHEGLRLARQLRRLSGDQRRDLKKSLTTGKSVL